MGFSERFTVQYSNIFSPHKSVYSANKQQFFLSIHMVLDINNEFSLEFGYLIDQVTSIMSIFTSIETLVLIYIVIIIYLDHGCIEYMSFFDYFHVEISC